MEQKRCMGCMQPTSEQVCPHCGTHRGADNGPDRLPAGTVLKGRYLLGLAVEQGEDWLSYMGWDMQEDQAVTVQEYYPSRLVIRQGPSVKPRSPQEVRRFQEGVERFSACIRKSQGTVDPSLLGMAKELFWENGTAYSVRTHFRGPSLDSFLQLRGGLISFSELLRLLDALLEGLANAHQAGVAHGDIRPENIVLDPMYGARLLDAGAYTDVSPETDVYAVCKLMQSCLTGAPLGGPVDLETVPGMTGPQKEVLIRGLSRDPGLRPDMGTLRAVLRGTAQLPLTAGSPGTVAGEPDGKQRKSRRKKMKLPVLIAVLGLCVLLALGVGAVILFGGEAHDDTDDFSDDVTVTEETLADTPTETVPPTTEAPEPWEANVLRQDPLALFGDKSAIVSVSFSDVYPTGRTDLVDLTQTKTGNVVGWIENGHVTIAAEGGVNGNLACVGLFSECGSLTSVRFGTAFHTDQASSMKRMFFCCYSLEEVDLHMLETGEVVNMESMFCMMPDMPDYDKIDTYVNTALTEPDVSLWDTSDVRNMGNMFYNCQGLRTLDVSRWDTSSVTNMRGMFLFCESLEEVDVSGWDISHVQDMGFLFCNCNALLSVDVSGWDTSSVTDMTNTFSECSALTELDVGDWNVSKVMYFSSTFSGCEKLKELDVYSWDVSSATDMTAMFAWNDALRKLDPSRWDVSRVTSMCYMFSGSDSLQMMDLSGWDVSKVRDMSNMFHTWSRNKPQVVKGVSSWDLSSVTKYEDFAPSGYQIDGKDWTEWFE